MASSRRGHAAVASSGNRAAGVETRLLTLVGGGDILEKSLGGDATSYGYEIIASPLPVADYKAIIHVVDVGGKGVLVWSSTFEDTSGNGAGEAAVIGVYEGGIAALKEKFP